MTIADDFLATLPELMAARIQAVLPGLRDCRGIVGRIDIDEVKRRGIAAPAVLVSRIGARQGPVLAGAAVTFNAEFAGFVITRDAPGLPRNEAAVVITQVLLRMIPGSRWGQPFLGEAHSVAELSLITSATERQAISLWAVTWVQPLTLTPLPDQPAITPEIYLGQSPRIGEAHVDDYDRIGETS